MSVQLPNGVVISLATTYAAADTVSAISNANPGVVTSNAHGLNDGDIVEMTSGWSRLNDRIVRVDSPAANTFNLEGIDTSNTTSYPVGTGTGTARAVSAWQQIQQILTSTTNGGEMQFSTYSFLEQDFETQIPTQSSPMTIELSIADDPALAGYIALKEAAEARDKRAIRLQMPNGSVLYANGYVSFNETPTMTKNEVMAVRATINLTARPTRYTS